MTSSTNNNNNNNKKKKKKKKKKKNDDDDDDDDNYNDNSNNNILILRRNSRFFLQSPHCAANRLQHVRSSGQGAVVCKSLATHRALITCNMSCYVPRGTKGQLSFEILQSLNLNYFSFILLAEPLTDDAPKTTRPRGRWRLTTSRPADHRRRKTRWGVTARSPTMVTLLGTRLVECRWWNDGCTVKTAVPFVLN